MFRRVFSYFLALLFSPFPRNKHLWVTGKVSPWDNGSEPPAFFDNSKYFFLYLCCNTSEKVYWLSSSKKEIELLKKMDLPVVKYPSIRGIFLLLRAKYSFHHYGPDQINSILQKSSVQLDFWHGTPLKKIRYDVVEKPAEKKSILRKLISRGGIEYIFSTSSYLSENILASAFATKIDNLLNFGYPRMDVLKLDEKDNYAFCKKYSPELIPYIDKAKKCKYVFLYMPTFRDDDPIYFLKARIDFAELNKKMATIDGIFFYKLHPLTEKCCMKDFENIVQIDNDVDIYPFLKYTNYLITDYSSIMFDFLFLDKEMIFIPFDMDNYTSHRELYFDYDSITPGIKYSSFSDFISNLEKIKTLDYSEQRHKIKKIFYDNYNYDACEKTYNYIKVKYK